MSLFICPLTVGIRWLPLHPGTQNSQAVRYRRSITEFMTAVEQLSIEALSGTQRSINTGGHCRTLHLTTAIEQKPLKFGQFLARPPCTLPLPASQSCGRNLVDQRRSVD